MYTSRNFKTKKELKEAVSSGQKIRVFNPGPFGAPPLNGSCCVEGPHFPQLHKWYASVVLIDGLVVSVK
jgi:hypothetical protein